MNQDLEDMSQYQIYKNYAYLTMDDVLQGLSKMDLNKNYKSEDQNLAASDQKITKCEIN